MHRFPIDGALWDTTSAEVYSTLVDCISRVPITSCAVSVLRQPIPRDRSRAGPAPLARGGLWV